MSYFANFGTTLFTLPDGTQIYINDITKFATIFKKYRDNPNLYLLYAIKDGDRPETISYTLYDDPGYWWLILLMNSIENVYDQWPLNYNDLQDYIESKYPFNMPTDLHHYENGMGIIYSPEAISIQHNITFSQAIVNYNLSPVTIEEYEYAQNELKRNIKLITPDYAQTLQTELSTMFAK